MPSDVESQLHLGRVLMVNGKYKDALDCFKTLSFFHSDNIIIDLSLSRANALLKGANEVTDIGRSAEPATVVCVKYGTKYGANYVNRLASMVRRQSSVDVDFFCLTDDPAGFGSRHSNLAVAEDEYIGPRYKW